MSKPPPPPSPPPPAPRKPKRFSWLVEHGPAILIVVGLLIFAASLFKLP